MPITPVDVAFTPLEQIPEIVRSLRRVFSEDIPASYEWRRRQLVGIYKLVTENEARIAEALQKDLCKPKFETVLSECGVIQVETVHAFDSLKEWMKPQMPSVPIQYIADTCMIQRQPYGVVLIISPWNYPVQLLLGPLIGAVAAGNTVVLKPSELAPYTANLLTELIPKYLDGNCVKVVNGSVDETQALLKERFDYIFYTGGPRVARNIMAAAAQHLTPVTLELGGKSPVFIDSTVDPMVVARRLCWGKFLNTGQTCIAPDYIICQDSIVEQFVSCLKDVVKKMYGENPKESPDYGRIINKFHFERLEKLISQEHVVLGGDTDPSQLYIGPTVLKGVSPESAVMESEIFGPILPIMVVKKMSEGLDFVLSRDKPLVIYAFSKDDDFVATVERKTSSGGLVVNDTLVHVGVSQLPFGGVGESGMGKYHGEASFLTFSHERSVMKRKTRFEDINEMRYAPYSDEKLDRIRMILFPRKIEENEGFFSSFANLFRSSSSSTQIASPRASEEPTTSANASPRETSVAKDSHDDASANTNVESVSPKIHHSSDADQAPIIEDYDGKDADAPASS